MGRFTAEERSVAEVLLEFVLVVAVMGAGLKIDRPFGFRAWASTWRLLGPAMLLTIVGIAVAAVAILGLPLPLALLLGSILSPTDPVLASGVQLGPPGAGEEGEVRFALTSEAGLNDGLAFPFVTLSLLWAGAPEPGWIAHWFVVELVWKLLAAVIVGIAVGGGIVALLAVRPVAVLVGFAGSRQPLPVRAAAEFFGIRGWGHSIMLLMRQSSSGTRMPDTSGSSSASWC